MAVFPESSKAHVPGSWRWLMYDPGSEIIDFYPQDFQVDLNGKKMAWQGVSLLPFVEESRLLAVLGKVYPQLTEDEVARNVRGTDRLFIGNKHKAFEFLMGIYENSTEKDRTTIREEGAIQWTELESSLAYGMAGSLAVAPFSCIPGETLKSPVEGCPDHPNNESVCVLFRDPQFAQGHVYPATRLKGAKDPPKELKPGDFPGGGEGGEEGVATFTDQ